MSSNSWCCWVGLSPGRRMCSQHRSMVCFAPHRTALCVSSRLLQKEWRCSAARMLTTQLVSKKVKRASSQSDALLASKSIMRFYRCRLRGRSLTLRGTKSQAVVQVPCTRAQEAKAAAVQQLRGVIAKLHLKAALNSPLRPNQDWWSGSSSPLYHRSKRIWPCTDNNRRS